MIEIQHVSKIRGLRYHLFVLKHKFNNLKFSFLLKNVLVLKSKMLHKANLAYCDLKILFTQVVSHFPVLLFSGLTCHVKLKWNLTTYFRNTPELVIYSLSALIKIILLPLQRRFYIVIYYLKLIDWLKNRVPNIKLLQIRSWTRWLESFFAFPLSSPSLPLLSLSISRFPLLIRYNKIVIDHCCWNLKSQSYQTCFLFWQLSLAILWQLYCFMKLQT